MATVSDGCTAPNVIDSATVPVNPLPAVNFLPHPLTGCEPLSAHFFDGSNTSVASSYIWNFGDGHLSSEQNPSHLYLRSGTYSVSLTVRSREGCVNDLFVPNAVIVYPLPTALFHADPERTSILDPTISFFDQSVEAALWAWDFGDRSGKSSLRNVSYTYQDTGNYRIRLITISDKGCIDSTFGRVVIEGDFMLYIPSAFTPNADGVNDGFIPSGIGVKEFDMYIFDRWGLQIFHSASMDQQWDGKVQGSEQTCQIDVYVYKILARDVRQRVHEYIGHVSLLR